MLSLRDSSRSETRDSSLVQRRGLSFFVSLLFHAFIFFLVFLFFPPLKSDLVGRKVADVIIVPPEKLFLSGVSPNTGLSSHIPQGIPAGREPRSLNPEEPPSPPGSLALDPALSSQFKLALPENIDTEDLSPDFEFDLALDQKDRFFPPVSEAETVQNIDLSKYSTRDYLNKYRTGNFDFQQGNSGSVVTRGAVSIQGEPYDISPWANRVVAEIQKNWFLSPQQSEVKAGRVEISIIIGRNGEVKSAEVLFSSRIELFDQAALKAIDIAPIPRLPLDFPAEQLKISLVFLVQ